MKEKRHPCAISSLIGIPAAGRSGSQGRGLAGKVMTFKHSAS